jgi:hypothetical protein
MLGPRPRLPCPRHGYPGCSPGALEISRVLNAWSQTKTPMPQAWLPWLLTRGPGYKPRVFNAWSQTKTPMPQAWLPWLLTRGPGYKPRVFNAWSQTKTPMPQAWLPWLLTRGPGYKPRVFIKICLRSHIPGVHWVP